MPLPDLTVVIITRDRCASLLRTLRQLEALPEAPAVVVVDNASADDTVAAVRRHHPGVDVVPLDHNAAAAARTVGVERARSPVVAFADDDSWWERDALARAARLFSTHPRLGLLAARVLVGEERRLDPTCALMAASPLPPEDDLPGVPVLGFLACGAVVRRAAFLEVGGFSPDYSVGGEETPLALDLAAHGWGLAYVESVTAVHHPAPRRTDHRRRRAEERNRVRLAWQRRRLMAALRVTLETARRGMSDPAARAALSPSPREALTWWRQRRPVPVSLERRLALVERSAVQ